MLRTWRFEREVPTSMPTGSLITTITHIEILWSLIRTCSSMTISTSECFPLLDQKRKTFTLYMRRCYDTRTNFFWNKIQFCADTKEKKHPDSDFEFVLDGAVNILVVCAEWRDFSLCDKLDLFDVQYFIRWRPQPGTVPARSLQQRQAFGLEQRSLRSVICCAAHRPEHLRI